MAARNANVVETGEKAVVGSAASDLIQAAASDRGLDVRRLGPAVVLCSSDEQRVAFKAFAGNMSGQVAHGLCRNQLALRSYLAARGVSTPVDNEVSADDILHVAVVGQRAIAVARGDGESPKTCREPVRELAIRAISVIPGLAYGSVAVANHAATVVPEVIVVDPLFEWWLTGQAGAGCRAIAEAVLDLEFAVPPVDQD